MPSPAPDTSTWPTHTEAAVQLATNERTIRRWIAAGRLRTQRRNAPGRKPLVIINPVDIERLRAERQPAVIVEPAAAAPMAQPTYEDNPDAMRQLAPRPDRIEYIQILRELAAAAAAVSKPKPWLTLAEAAEYSGLPKSFLIAQAREGRIRAVNVGTGEREFWRFNRDALSR